MAMHMDGGNADEAVAQSAALETRNDLKVPVPGQDALLFAQKVHYLAEIVVLVEKLGSSNTFHCVHIPTASKD